jgi:hypothetical protein
MPIMPIWVSSFCDILLPIEQLASRVLVYALRQGGEPSMDEAARLLVESAKIRKLNLKGPVEALFTGCGLHFPPELHEFDYSDGGIMYEFNDPPGQHIIDSSSRPIIRSSGPASIDAFGRVIISASRLLVITSVTNFFKEIISSGMRRGLGRWVIEYVLII